MTIILWLCFLMIRKHFINGDMIDTEVLAAMFWLFTLLTITIDGSLINDLIQKL